MSSIALFWHYTSSEVQFLDLVFLQPYYVVQTVVQAHLVLDFALSSFPSSLLKSVLWILKINTTNGKIYLQKGNYNFFPLTTSDSTKTLTQAQLLDYLLLWRELLCLNHSTQSHFEDKNKICRSRGRSRRSLYNFGKHSDHFW